MPNPADYITDPPRLTSYRFSLVLTKSAEYWGSHDSVIRKYGLKDGLGRIGLLRAIFQPTGVTDISEWRFLVRQDLIPDWTFPGDPLPEERAREALARHAEAHRWYARAEGGQVEVGYAGTAIAGDHGEAVAGFAGTAQAGDFGRAMAGTLGTANAGGHASATVGPGGSATVGPGGGAMAEEFGTASAGVRGMASAGRGGVATAGDGGVAIAGDGGGATAGDGGVARVGRNGTATVGARGGAQADICGTAVAGIDGCAAAGPGGEIRIAYLDDAGSERVAVGRVGEDGIEPGTAYRVREGRLVRWPGGVPEVLVDGYPAELALTLRCRERVYRKTDEPWKEWDPPRPGQATAWRP